MISMEFDKVKAEKQDAMRRYKRQKYTLFCFNLLVLSILIYSSFSSSLPFLLHKASLYLPLHLRVFLLLNATVLLVYYSSSSTNNALPTPQQTSELYYEYVSHSSLKQLVVLPPLEDTVDKQIVVRQVNEPKVVVENKVRDITVVKKINEEKGEEEKCYRRTTSEKYVRDNVRRNVLRRTETEKAMEEMNNEEFRLTIERFIESKKKMSRDENMASLRLLG